MANRYLKQHKGHMNTGVVLLEGRLDIHTDASVLSTTDFLGGAITKTGTGEYTITLEDTYNKLLACNLTLSAATPVDLVPQVTSEDVDGAKTIVFSLCAAAVATDPSAATSVYISLKLKDSSVAY